VFAALAIVLLIATTQLAALRLRAVRASVGENLGALILELKRVDVAERWNHAAEKVKSGTFEARLLESLEGLHDERAKVVATNEALGDLALLLSQRSRWSTVAVRIVLLGSALLGVLCLPGVYRTVTEANGVGATPYLIQLAVVCLAGGIGLSLVVLMGGRADALEKKQRKLADDLVDVLVPGAPKEASVGRRFKDRL
jgi:hypothetical protein